ncbi:MAG: PPOX class F420-dependent oxidoreductase [Chloroflexi bacterium]|nr:PPOX class F420-dependent oxidoreductase [Chloroflexota bacterium]
MLKERTMPFKSLSGQAFMCLTTFRKSGEPVPTPVWFAGDTKKVYVMTQANAGKVKRIRNNAQVEVAPCTSRGDLLGAAVEAMARILPPDQVSEAKAALTQKYGWQKRIFDLMNRMRGKDMLYIEVTPME